MLQIGGRLQIPCYSDDGRGGFSVNVLILVHPFDSGELIDFLCVAATFYDVFVCGSRVVLSKDSLICFASTLRYI